MYYFFIRMDHELFPASSVAAVAPRPPAAVSDQDITQLEQSGPVQTN